MKGTQLTQLSSDYEQIRESVDDTLHIITKNKAGLEDLHKKAKEAELRYREMLEAQELEDQIDDLNNELVWLQIITKEKDVAKAQLDARKATETLQATEATFERQQVRNIVKWKRTGVCTDRQYCFGSIGRNRTNETGERGN
jgi:hypothetical protein